MAEGALSDLKVVEYASFINGPYCSKFLADLGAEVIKVEDPKGDEARKHGPFPADIPHPEKSGLFLYLNRNKLGVTLDLKTSSGVKLFKELVRGADILVENNPPSMMMELGLDYHTLSQVNPRLIMTSITPFGQTGPYKDYKGTDLISFHMGGLGYGTPNQVEDPEEERPLRAAGRQADYLTGVTAATAAMLAVFARGVTGEGQHVDISEQETVASIMFINVSRYYYQNVVPTRLKTEAAGGAMVLPCKDGYFIIETLEERQWRWWVEIMGNPEWAENELFQTRTSRGQYWEALRPLVEEFTMQHTQQELTQLGQAKRIPVFPTNTPDGVVDSQQLADRGFFMEMDHPQAGRFKYPWVPYKNTETPAQFRYRAPLLGEHNEEVYCRRLGITREELARLRAAGVI